MLFEAITRLPEYYPSRTEREILSANIANVSLLIGPGRVVVECGSGSSAKIPVLLSAVSPAAYIPVDISGDFLRESANSLITQFPDLPIYPVEGDFTYPIEIPALAGTSPRLGSLAQRLET